MKGTPTLQEGRPEIAAQWDSETNGDLTPSLVTLGSGRKVGWIGPCGHRWQAVVATRAKGAGCPFCSGNRALPGVSDLATTDPDLAAQWHPTRNRDRTPSEVKAGSDKKAWWLGPCGHEWQAAPLFRKAGGTGCPYCANVRVLAGFNDLATIRPDLAGEWHSTRNGSLTPRDVVAVSTKAVWWECSRGHEWAVAPRTRINNGTGCPYCSGYRAVPGETDLATTHPDLAAQWHPTKNGGLTPRDVKAGSERVVWWIGPCGHEWAARIPNRALHGFGCSFCSNTRVLPGFNDLATSQPGLASQWHPTKNGDLTPDRTAPLSNRKVWWLGPCGHEWPASPADRARTDRETGCPFCSHLVSRGEDQVLELLSLLVPEQTVARTVHLPGMGRRNVDLLVEESRLAIEYNGLRWHSERFRRPGEHEAKVAAVRAAGYRLFVIWEDDWSDPSRRVVVVRSLAHRLGATSRLAAATPDLPLIYSERVGARELSLRSVPRDEARDFLRANHLQGAAVGTRSFGAYDRDGRLRALLAVKGRDPGQWEIVRYASAGIVAGGFSRLVAFAEREIRGQGGCVRTWVTFADASVSDGALYEASGFVADRRIGADYSYIVGRTREHKFTYRLSRFRADPALQYRDGLTEAQLADLNGLTRVWDYGKTRYVRDALVPKTPAEDAQVA